MSGCLLPTGGSGRRPPMPSATAMWACRCHRPLCDPLTGSSSRSCFTGSGCRPAAEISPADMERLIDSWLQMRPCPVSRSLESLWQRGQARERIASVAAVELRSWDGALADCDPAESRRTGGVQLLCWLRRFPKRRLEISFLASLGTQASPQALTVLTATGEPSRRGSARRRCAAAAGLHQRDRHHVAGRGCPAARGYVGKPGGHPLSPAGRPVPLRRSAQRLRRV